MVTKCQLSRNLQVRERANTVSTEDGLVKTEPRVQDTKEAGVRGTQLKQAEAPPSLQHRSHQEADRHQTGQAAKTIRKM